MLAPLSTNRFSGTSRFIDQEGWKTWSLLEVFGLLPGDHTAAEEDGILVNARRYQAHDADF